MEAALVSGSHYLCALRDDEDLPALDSMLKDVCRTACRRVDRFVRLALLGSARCAQGHELHPDCGVYIGSAHGPLASNICVQQQMLCQHELPKPFNFINTLGGMAGFHVVANLQLGGPSLFISRYVQSLQAVLEMALVDLAVGAVDQALVGVVEEAPLPLAEQRLRLGVDANVALAEGSHWLLLEQGAQTNPGRTLALHRYATPEHLESYLMSHADAGTAVCLGRSADPVTAQVVRSVFPNGVAGRHLPLPFHDSVEAAWFVARATARMHGGTLLIDSDDNGGGCLLHLSA